LAKWLHGMPEPNVGYYVHHHGAGHGVRAASIAQALQVPVTLIGSQLPEALPAGVQRLQLPGDTARGMRVERFDALHYAPLAVDGVRERMAMLAQWFSEHWPCLLVVDVSVEIAVFARLCAVPVIYIRQHGTRDDAAHRLAYESASALLAPYPAEMEAPDTPQWLRDKTTYSGWLSRFAGTPCATPQSGRVLIITGHGGTGLSTALIEAVARQCPERQFRVAGGLAPEDAAAGSAVPNLQWLGHLSNPAQEMRCAEIVVGSASDSLVGEAASLGCRYIAVADDRPFDEQRRQARRLNALNVAIGSEHGWPAASLWPALFDAALGLDPGRWRGWANEAAAAQAARFIEDTLMKTTQTQPFRNPGV
jgi:predicted glycosyltransferase